VTRFFNLGWGDCLFVGAIFLALLMLFVGVQNNENNGIISHSSGQAVYLTGEACVVNYQDMEAMAIQMGWCLDQRRKDE